MTEQKTDTTKVKLGESNEISLNYLQEGGQESPVEETCSIYYSGMLFLRFILEKLKHELREMCANVFASSSTMTKTEKGTIIHH